MTKITLILLTFLLTATSSFSNDKPETAPPMGIRDKTPDVKAFINARIVVSPEQTIEQGTLLIRDGHIAAVGETVTIPDGVDVVDLKGKTIYPGFIDPYTEYGLQAVGDLYPKKKGRNPVYESSRVGAGAWNDALHPEKDWVSRFAPDDESSRELMQLGYTTVQSVKMDGILRGRGFVTLLGEGLPNELVIEADNNHFVSFDKGSSQQEYPSSLMGSIALIRQTLLDADWYKAMQAAHAKNPQQSMPEYNRAIEALSDYRNQRYIFECDDALTELRADRLAREFGLSIVTVGTNDEYSQLDGIKATGRTLILPVEYPETPEVKTVEDELDVTLGALRHWERAPANPYMLHEDGITFAFTTHGLKKKKDFLKNIRKAIEHGLPEAAALAALTTVPAEICGVADRTGTLEPGMLANFFVCDGDIFAEEPTVFATWTAGRKTELKPLDLVDFRGYYDLEIDTLKLRLKFTNKLSDLWGYIIPSGTKIRLKHVTAEQNRIFFTAEMDSLGMVGVVRFAGSMVNDTILGLARTLTSDNIPWRAIKTSPYVEKDESKRVIRPGMFASRLTYPNVGYGFQTVPQPEDVLVKNATLWTCEGDDRPEVKDLLIRNGKFAAVGTNLSVPSGVRVIDATGKHVTPGIIDEHSHVACSGDINEGSLAITPETRIGDIINPGDINVYRALAGGTTTIHTLHGSANPIGAQNQVIKCRWGHSSEEMKFDKAPPTMKWALGENVKQSNWGEQFTVRYPQSRMGVETIIRDALQAAVEYEAKWAEYDGLKTKQRERTIPPRRDLGLEALLEVIRSRMFLTVHAYVQSEMLMLMRLGEEYGFTINTLTHVLEGYKVAAEMAEHGACAGSAPDWWAYKFEVYDAIQQNPCILVEHGVVTSINSDSPELGRRLNQEAAKSVMYCDMDPVDALKMVTINPARQLHVEQRVGSIREGKDADFVIWTGHPLSVYSHPEQTWVDGRKYFDIEADHAERKAILEERNRLIQEVLREKPDWDWEKYLQSHNKKGGSNETH